VFSREQIHDEIERLANSEALHNSESLCKLLRYLAEQSMENPGAAIKEYQIATEVFHRSADFDPQLDSVIRVQAGRLRTKLASYYTHEGEDDRIIVELPKGNYALHFRENPRRIKSGETPETKVAEHVEALQHHSNAPEEHPRSSPLVPVLSTLLVLALAALIVMSSTRRGVSADTAAAANLQSAPAALQIFWGQFLATPEAPWVVFSNASFVGRPETGLRYYNPAAGESQTQIFDHYTGVGEVLSVHALDDVFATLHGRVRVKRGSLFTLDDLKQNNLIFLGSPAENLTLRDIPSTSHFVFQRVASGARAGDLSIATVAPRPGEPAVSLASPNGQPLAEDYAVVGLKKISDSHLVLIVAGTTTFGTQGAVEYLCRQESLQTLLDHLGVHKPGELHPFEALLRIRISHGVPVDETLVAVSSN
jgi:hypothetical protein